MISTEEGEKLSVLNKEIRFMEKRRKDCKLTHERDLPLAGQIGQIQKTTPLLNDQEPTNSFQKNTNQKHIQPKIIIFFKFRTSLFKLHNVWKELFGFRHLVTLVWGRPSSNSDFLIFRIRRW